VEASFVTSLFKGARKGCWEDEEEKMARRAEREGGGRESERARERECDRGPRERERERERKRVREGGKEKFY
jgi:hypothetical protein